MDASAQPPDPPPAPRPEPYDVSADPPGRPEPLPRFARASGGVPNDPTLAEPVPVPADPPHHCPACDYNLTGLYSRRCPECGRPFRLFEARLERWPPTPEMVQDRREARHDRWRMILGATLTLVGYLAPVVWHRSMKPAWVISMIAVPAWILSLGAAYRMDLKCNFAVAWAGIVIFVIGMLVLLL